MSFIFRDRDKLDEGNMIDIDLCKSMPNNNDNSEWLLLLALFNILKEHPELSSQYTNELKSKNEKALVDRNDFCCTIKPIDPLKMGESISKPCAYDPFEGYSREEIKMLLDYRGKEI